MKKRSIKIGHELIAVNEETYKEYTRWKDRVRYQAQRDGKCGYPSNWRCDGDCGNCRYTQEGYNMISYALLTLYDRRISLRRISIPMR